MDQSTIIACIITGVIAFFVGGALCFFVGVQYRRKVAEAELGSAEEEAKRILSDAIKSAESRKKEALVEAKDEIYKMRTEAEKDVKERRSEVTRQDAGWFRKKSL